MSYVRIGSFVKYCERVNNVVEQTGLYHGSRESRKGREEDVGSRAEGVPMRVRAEQSPDFGDGRSRSQNGFLMTRDESCILVTYTPHTR